MKLKTKSDMVGIFRIIVLLVFTVSTFAQGTIFFNNRTSVGDVPIALPNGTGFGSTPGGASAQLFLVPSGGGVLIPLLPATTFRTSTPAATFYVNPVDVTVPGIAPGNSATIVMRVWETLAVSYDAATIRGESAPLTISALGGINPQTGAIIPTPDLSGLQFVPEPSTIALGVLSAVALLFRRRN